MADVLVGYYQTLKAPHIATNVIKAIGFHAAYRHVPFFLSAIRDLSSQEETQHVVHALDSALGCIGRLGNPEQIEDLWTAGAAWKHTRPHATVARALTMMLVKRDGRGMTALDADYSHRILAFRSSFGDGPAGVVAETRGRLQRLEPSNPRFLGAVLAEMASRFDLMQREGEILGFSYSPTAREVQQPSYQRKMRKLMPEARYCVLCGARQSPTTVKVFKRLAVCIRCGFTKLREWLVEHCGLDPELWRLPPRGSPVSQEKRIDGPSAAPKGIRRRWHKATIRSYDSMLDRVRASGADSSNWHGLLGRYGDQIESVETPSGIVVRFQEIAELEAAASDAWFYFILWQGDYYLRYEKDARWRSEMATLRIIAELLGEQPMRQWTTEWLINPLTKINLYVDGFFPRHRLAVEHQGRQHFEPIDWFGGAAAHRALMERDALKVELLAAR